MIKEISMISNDFLTAIFTDIRFILAILALYMMKKTYFLQSSTFIINKKGVRAAMLSESFQYSILFGLIAGILTSETLFLSDMVFPTETWAISLTLVILALFIEPRLANIPTFLLVAGLIESFSGNFETLSPLLFSCGIMMLLQGGIVLVNGKKDSAPIYIKTISGIAGAYVSRQYYVLPFIYPLLAATPYGLGIAIAGYSYTAVSTTPENAARWQAGIAGLIGAICILGWKLSSINNVLGIVIAIIAPLLYYAGQIIYRHLQEHRLPIYNCPAEGIKILKIIPDGQAEKLGIKASETILSINGKYTQTLEGLQAALEDYPRIISVELEDREGKVRTVNGSNYPDGFKTLGVVIVPRESNVTFQEVRVKSFNSITAIVNVVAKFTKEKE